MSFYLVLIIVSLLCSFCWLVVSVVNSASDHSFYLIFLTFCGFVYVLGHLLKITAMSAEAALVGIRVQYVGLPFIAPLFYLFACSILREKQLKQSIRALIFIPSLILALGFQVLRVFELYINQVAFVMHGGFAHWQLKPGLLQNIDRVYSYLFFVLSLLLIYKTYQRVHRYRRKQVHILLAALLIPVFTKVLGLLPAMVNVHDYTPVALVISTGMLLHLVRYYNLLKVIPLARTQVIEQMKDALIICDAGQHYLDANTSAQRLFPHIRDLRPGDPFFPNAGQAFEQEMQLEMDGSLRTFKVSQSIIRQNNKVQGIGILLHDITEKQAMVDQLYERGTFDGLMNILNRASFFERAELALTDSGSEFALLMLDIDHFKEVNDRYGHACGDQALKMLGEILRKELRKTDLFGRFGGEEIVILMEGISASAALGTAKRLNRVIGQTSLEYGGHIFNITVSIGVVHAKKGEAHQLDDLLEKADRALYSVKDKSRNSSRLYDHSDDLSQEAATS